jgi:hypothetical protein
MESTNNVVVVEGDVVLHINQKFLADDLLELTETIEELITNKGCHFLKDCRLNVISFIHKHSSYADSGSFEVNLEPFIMQAQISFLEDIHDSTDFIINDPDGSQGEYHTVSIPCSLVMRIDSSVSTDRCEVLKQHLSSLHRQEFAPKRLTDCFTQLFSGEGADNPCQHFDYTDNKNLIERGYFQFSKPDD